MATSRVPVRRTDAKLQRNTEQRKNRIKKEGGLGSQTGADFDCIEAFLWSIILVMSLTLGDDPCA
jgi:hypothetical protein